MSSLSEKVRGALKEAPARRGRIIVPEWSEFFDFASVLKEAIQQQADSQEVDFDEVVESLGVALHGAELVGDVRTAVEVMRFILDTPDSEPRIDILHFLADELDIERTGLVDPFECYYRQPSVADAQKINRLSEGDQHKAMCYTLIYALRDDDDKKILDAQDIPRLMSAPVDLINRLCNEIARRPRLEESIKNS